MLYVQTRSDNGLPKIIGLFDTNCINEASYFFFTGRRAGVFFSRNLVPDAEGNIIAPTSMFIGGIVSIFSHVFELTGADEFTCAYMEQSADQVSEVTLAVMVLNGFKCFSEQLLFFIILWARTVLLYIR
jgi:hypothetical protein